MSRLFLTLFVCFVYKEHYLKSFLFNVSLIYAISKCTFSHLLALICYLYDVYIFCLFIVLLLYVLLCLWTVFYLFFDFGVMFCNVSGKEAMHKMYNNNNKSLLLCCCCLHVVCYAMHQSKTTMHLFCFCQNILKYNKTS